MEDFKILIGCSSLNYSKEVFERALCGISKAGLQFVEISSIPGYCEHVRPEHMTSDDLKRLKRVLEEFEIKPMSIAGHIDFKYYLAGENREYERKAVELLKKRIDLATYLDARIVSTGVGVVDNKEKLERFYSNLAEVIDYCEDRQVVLCLETLKGITETAEDCLKIMKKVDSKYIGVNYDTANVRYYAGIEPEDDLGNHINDLLKFFTYIHVKDHIRGEGWNFPAIGKGEINFKNVFHVLKMHGFKGPFSIELQYSGPSGEETPPSKIDEDLLFSYDYLKQFNL